MKCLVAAVQGNSTRSENEVLPRKFPPISLYISDRITNKDGQQMVRQSAQCRTHNTHLCSVTHFCRDNLMRQNVQFAGERQQVTPHPDLGTFCSVNTYMFTCNRYTSGQTEGTKCLQYTAAQHFTSLHRTDNMHRSTAYRRTDFCHLHKQKAASFLKIYQFLTYPRNNPPPFTSVLCNAERHSCFHKNPPPVPILRLPSIPRSQQLPLSLTFPRPPIKALHAFLIHLTAHFSQQLIIDPSRTTYNY